MGNFFLRKSSKQTSKLKSLLRLAVARLAVVRRPSLGRRAIARGDVGQLLGLGHLERALLRAEQVIEEDNMLEAFDIIELYCSLLIDQAVQLDKPKECSEEIKEAAAGLVFAAARCGKLPELQDARAILADKFGKDFAKAAKEGTSGVDPTLVQKWSDGRTSMELKKKLTKVIATENNIKLDFPEPANETKPGKQNMETKNTATKEIVAESQVQLEFHEGKRGSLNTNMNARSPQAPPPPVRESVNPSLAELNIEEKVLRESKKYLDARTAAEAAFESASFAAMAARAAVALSRSESQGKGSGAPGDQSPRASARENGKVLGGRDYDKVHPVQNLPAMEQEAPPWKLEKSPSPTSSWSDMSTVTSARSEAAEKGKRIVFDKSDGEEDEEDMWTTPLRRPPRRRASALDGSNSHNAWREEVRKVGTDAPSFQDGVYGRLSYVPLDGNYDHIARHEDFCKIATDDERSSREYKSSAHVRPPYRRNATALDGGNVHEEVRKLGTDEPLFQGSVYRRSSTYVRPPYRRNASALEGSDDNIAQHEELDDKQSFQERVYESSAYVHPPYGRIVSALEGSNEHIARHEEVRKIGTDARSFQESVYGVSDSDSSGERRLNPERRAISVRTRR